MDFFTILSLIFVATAGFSVINCRYWKLPTTIGLMINSIIMSFALILIGELSFFSDSLTWAKETIQLIKFDELVIRGMLGILLFASALHVNFEDLYKNKMVIGLLATVGVVFSAFGIAFTLRFLLELIGIPIPFLYCLLFGSIISPTDPIAVMSILKSLGASPSLQAKIAGESLFNDGVAIVMFSVIFGVLYKGGSFEWDAILWLFVRESLGGAILGLLLGYIAYLTLKLVDDYITEILITIAVVFAGGSLSHHLHVSEPIVAVCAGLLIGNRGRQLAMSDKSSEHIDIFWHLVDEIMNSILFVLLGLEVLVLSFKFTYFLAGILAVPVVLITRFIGVAGIINLLRLKRSFPKKVIPILTWGGLRGGISIALALSLPESDFREVIISMTFIVVIFSVIVQGLTVKRLFQ